jgi:battenin
MDKVSDNLVDETKKPFIVPRTVQKDQKDRGLWRDLLSYWIFGLCNNYGYVIILTAAFDVLKQLEEKEGIVRDESEVILDGGRYCNLMSTGAILLAITVPSILIKFTMPFLPFVINVRVFGVCGLVGVGLTLVALAETQWVVFLGVAFAAMSCELGETSFLAYSANFNK